MRPKDTNPMTIGIGVLCSTHSAQQDVTGRTRPDAVVMLADTMLSNDTDSTHAHKILMSPERGVYAVAAGRLEIAGELFSFLSDSIAKMTMPRLSGSVYGTLSHWSRIHRQEKFKFEIIDPYFLQNEQGTIPESSVEEMQRCWRDYHPGVEMLFAVFNDTGQVILYEVNGAPDPNQPGFVKVRAFPGHWSIGTGAYNASMWLNYRKQHLGMSVERSALHAFEAGRFAGSAPTVNDEIEVLIATKETHFHMGKDRVIGTSGLSSPDR